MLPELVRKNINTMSVHLQTILLGYEILSDANINAISSYSCGYNSIYHLLSQSHPALVTRRAAYQIPFCKNVAYLDEYILRWQHFLLHEYPDIRDLCSDR
jgi:hypothetical protein